MAQGRIACLLGPGFEDSEFRLPYDALKNAGYQVDIISMKAGMELKGYKGKETVKSEKGIDDVRADDYQAI
ncbi:MAG: DJ-1/PfpI family protein, partial [Myxococcales bacterium]